MHEFPMTKKIYLAGPEVFLPNAREMLDLKASLARDVGFTPLSPGDLQIPPADTRIGHGCNINAVDERMMLEADAVIANLTPFRGIAADTGTSFELGFMCALGKPVFAYTNVAANHFTRIKAHYGGVATIDETGRTGCRSRISTWSTISCCMVEFCGVAASSSSAMHLKRRSIRTSTPINAASRRRRRNYWDRLILTERN